MFSLSIMEAGIRCFGLGDAKCGYAELQTAYLQVTEKNDYLFLLKCNDIVIIIY